MLLLLGADPFKGYSEMFIGAFGSGDALIATLLKATPLLSSEPTVLIASQPTRGVDIGAAEYIHRRIIDKRNVMTDAEFIQRS